MKTIAKCIIEAVKVAAVATAVIGGFFAAYIFLYIIIFEL